MLSIFSSSERLKTMAQGKSVYSKRTLRIIEVIVAAVSLTVVALILTLFVIPDLLTPQFDFTLAVSSSSNTVQKGGSLQINVSVTYLQGAPETVALSASGGPDGATYSFSNQTGTPTAIAPFSCNLTVMVPASASVEIYVINVTAAAANRKTYSLPCEISVLDVDIQVSGTVTVKSSEPIYPTEIQFVNTATNQTYKAIVNTTPSSPSSAVLVQQGRYSISLPNHQSYRVTCTWTRLLGPWGVSPTDELRGTFDGGSLDVDCAVGVTSIVRDFPG